MWRARERYVKKRSQSDVLLLVLGLLAELPQLHQAAHDLTELHPPELSAVEVGEIPGIRSLVTSSILIIDLKAGHFYPT